TRVNLGLFQHDVSVIWDLAPHDLAIMVFLIQAKPEAVVATGEAHLNGLADVAYLTIYFPGNTIAHINVNWLSPVKIRTTFIDCVTRNRTPLNDGVAGSRVVRLLEAADQSLSERGKVIQL